jgi:hypothetical protein
MNTPYEYTMHCTKVHTPLIIRIISRRYIQAQYFFALKCNDGGNVNVHFGEMVPVQVLYTIHYVLCSIHYVLYTVHYVLYTIHYVLYTTHTACTIHYTLYTGR